MLRELRIRNFVLIEELHLEFDGGFNCLTGETGAGKSIIVDALGLLLGDRVRGDLIRPGAEEASVEAVFHGFDSRREKQIRRCLSEFGLEADPEGLFIKRLIRRDGKGRCYVNSSPTQLKILEALGDLLVDIHGQHDHQSLLHGEVYIDLLDAYGGVEEEAEEVTRQFGEIQRLQSEIDRLMETHRERMRQEDHLKFQIQEIEQAEIVPEEEAILEQDRRRRPHSEHLAAHAAYIQSTLKVNRWWIGWLKCNADFRKWPRSTRPSLRWKETSPPPSFKSRKWAAKSVSTPAKSSMTPSGFCKSKTGCTCSRA
jgi:DNA repair protein RecN (Recombination protein N)